MKTIIEQYLSDMLDKLLEKALEDEPKEIDEWDIIYDNLTLNPFNEYDNKMVKRIFQEWWNDGK